MNGIQRGRRGFGFFFPFRRRHQALPLSLPHEFLVFCGAGSGRRVGRKAPRPLRESIGDSGREPLVDAAASAERARGKRNGNDSCEMADADGHVRKRPNREAMDLYRADRLRSISSRWIGVVAMPSLLLKKVKLAYLGELGIWIPHRSKA